LIFLSANNVATSNPITSTNEAIIDSHSAQPYSATMFIPI